MPNPGFMGVELTTTLEDLLAALGSDVEQEIRGSFAEGTLTLMFADIKDSSLLARESGNQRWAEVTQWHDDTIREIVAAHCFYEIARHPGRRTDRYRCGVLDNWHSDHDECERCSSIGQLH